MQRLMPQGSLTHTGTEETCTVYVPRGGQADDCLVKKGEAVLKLYRKTVVQIVNVKENTY